LDNFLHHKPLRKKKKKKPKKRIVTIPQMKKTRIQLVIMDTLKTPTLQRRKTTAFTNLMKLLQPALLVLRVTLACCTADIVKLENIIKTR